MNELNRLILFRYGNKFVNSCKNYLHNEEDETWLLAAIEMKWKKIENQIQY